MKKKEFNVPFIGYDYGKDNGWNYDALIGECGNPVFGIKIKNIVQQYSADPDEYLRFQSVLQQVVSTLGEGRLIQKLDIFGKKKYRAEPAKEFLQQKYSEHFEGRIYKTIDTLLIFTDIIDNKKKKAVYKFDERKYKDFRDKMDKIFMILDQSGCEPQFLFEKDWEYYIGGGLSMNFGEVRSFDNIDANLENLRIGSKFVKTIAFTDVENMEMPNEIDPYSVLGGNQAAKDTAVDNFSFINELEQYQTIIYNQIISIPKQGERQRDLGKKQKKHEGAASNSPGNAIIAEEIQTLLYNIASDGQLIVDAHFSLLISCENREDMDKTTSTIETKLFQKGIIVSQSAYNQLELFRACIAGNAVELKDYDLFTTTSEAALCFFFKESYPISEKSNFYLRFTDRQGVPLKIDPADLPMQTGRINNRNKFVLGPSGSGKSFLMNNIVEQYLTYNYDVIIVDTGDSYSGTNKYYNGKYVQYLEEKPITMNPFNVTKEELNIEKTEFLGNLIFLIWQGANAEMTTTQKSILDNLLQTYYHDYFYGGTAWYGEKSTTDLILYLQKFNIYEEDILNEFNAQYQIPDEIEETYYKTLLVNTNASFAEITQSYRRLSLAWHPDREPDETKKKAAEDKMAQINEAYDTLSDKKKRKEYDETHLIPVLKREVAKRPKINTPEWDEGFRGAIIKKITDLDKKLNVKELSFNSFYEFAQEFLPIYLKNKKHEINEKEFNVRTFLFVLKDFYKGGKFGTTLNENADNSLFDEPFIVFEIDNVKDNPTLFPIVTLIIMDTFIQKMRLRKDRRKALIIEEAWKAIASKLMGGYILYLYKTVRKFWGEAVVVTQELDDIIGNAVVKDSIINNSDTFILLDQTKFKDNFDKIASLLSLNQVERNKIFTINNLNNKFNRARFKEFYLKRGSVGEVYGNEVSIYQYLTYTTEKPEKTALEYYVKSFGTYQNALEKFVADLDVFRGGMGAMVQLINLYKKPLDSRVVNFYHQFEKENRNQNIFKIIQNEMLMEECTFDELINLKSNNYRYETV